MKTGYKDMHCGLIGEHLGHSFSPQIHSLLADYSYELFELERDGVGYFVKHNSLDAYNVTIPYKKDVMPFLDVISKEAATIGAVNTIVRRDGRLYGYNTDYFGFSYTIDFSKIKIKGKKALVLGAGGASATVCAVLRDRGVRELIVVSSKTNTPEFLSKHTDTDIIVNASPVGMYPHNGVSPVDLSLFPTCSGVLDLIYNPSKTQLLLDAEAKGIPHVNGLPMLVAQAAKAFELFTGDAYEQGICERIIRAIEAETKNIILIGMPGCGKSTVGRLIAKKLGRPFFDADDEFSKTFTQSPADIIREQGEDKFRQMEHEVTKALGKKSGAVISCGGGVITREYNYAPLHQNGTVIFLERELSRLSKKGRPLSQATSVQELYNARIDAYLRFADLCVASTEIPEKTAELMIKKLSQIQKGDFHK